ncbi:hypothetical protein VTN96DRAFT_1076 [Rasamsonia emersonii]
MKESRGLRHRPPDGEAAARARPANKRCGPLVTSENFDRPSGLLAACRGQRSPSPLTRALQTVLQPANHGRRSSFAHTLLLAGIDRNSGGTGSAEPAATTRQADGGCSVLYESRIVRFDASANGHGRRLERPGRWDAGVF